MWLPTHILGKNTQRICGKLHRIMWIYTQIIWAKVTYGRMVFTFRYVVPKNFLPNKNVPYIFKAAILCI